MKLTHVAIPIDKCKPIAADLPEFNAGKVDKDSTLRIIKEEIWQNQK